MPPALASGIYPSDVQPSAAKGVRCAPDGDKVMCLNAQTATIENGFVHLPREAHRLADYLSELTLFPAARYDDQVDSTARGWPG